MDAEDRSTIGKAIPISMANLDLDKYCLLRKLLDNLMVGNQDQGVRNSRFMHGALHEGFPTDPKQPSSCSYIEGSLPSPNLGNIPRDEIYEELKKDPNREAKQRRDLGIPDGDTVPFVMFNVQYYCTCLFSFFLTAYCLPLTTYFTSHFSLYSWFPSSKISSY